MIKELSPIEFKKWQDNSQDLELIDVRTKEEFDIVNLGGKLIPLGEIQMRYEEIDQKKNIILLCHHGRRSLIAANILESLNFNNLYNLTGGIDAYAIKVDPKIARY